MNRRKKIKQILAKRDKKANAKKHCSSKPRYISKADRAKLEQQAEPVSTDSEAGTEA